MSALLSHKARRVSVPLLPARGILLAFSALLVLVAFASPVSADGTGPHVQTTMPAIWQVSNWAVPQGESVEELLTSVATLAGRYQRVAIAGDGPMADSLTHALQSRLGNDRVSQTQLVTSADKLGSYISGTKTDLIIHITDTPPESWTPDEQFFIKVDDVKEMQDAVLSGFHVLRAVEGMLNDSRTVAGPLSKKTVGALQKAFGDWSTPEAKGILARWDKTSDTADKILKGFRLLSAANQDVTASSQGKWTLANSKLLDQGIHWLAEDGTAMVLKKLKVLKDADAEALPGAIGFTELADAASQQIHDGHFTVDALENYMDAAVRASWFAVGLLVSGDNVRVAKHVGDLAVAAAKAGRFGTAQPIKALYDRFFGTEIDGAFDQWQVEQISNARRGLPLVTWEDWATKAGFDVNAKPELKEKSAEVFNTCQRLNNAEKAAKSAPAPIIAVNGPPQVDVPGSETEKKKPEISSPSAGPPPAPRGGVSMPATVLKSKASDKADTNDIFGSDQKK